MLSVPVQLIAWEDRPRNDLLCVERDVKHLLTHSLCWNPSVINDLQVAGGGKGKQVSYPYFMAFISLLNNMELLKQIHEMATRRSSLAELTKGCYYDWIFMIN